MSRVLVRLGLAATAPRFLADPAARGPTPFGTWALAQLLAVVANWPGLAFHRLHLTAGGLTLLLRPHHGVTPLVTALAVARAVTHQTTRDARLAGWVPMRAPLWEPAIVVVVLTREESHDLREATGAGKVAVAARS